VHLADDDPKSFWLARALTNLNPDPRHIHQIQIQYWTLASGCHIDMDTYAGWDIKAENVWRKDRVIPPCWSNTDCIMTSFKPCMKKGIDDVPLSMTKVMIPKPQIKIIKSSMAAFMSDSNDKAASSESEE